MRWLILCYIFLFSCSNKKPLIYEGWSMTMPYKVIIEDPLDLEQMQKVLDITNFSLKEIDLIYNNWNLKSEISKFNNLEDTLEIEVSKELADLIKISDYVHTLSQKRFDPTVGPLSMAFHKAFHENTELVTTASYQIGWENVSIDNQVLKKEHQNVALDLCGISKGYLLDLLLTRLKNEGIHNALVEWAGEVRVMGRKKNGPWKIKIDDRLDPVELNNEAIASSGSEFHYIVQNEKITHVINPFKKKPKPLNAPVYRVTVKAKSCAVADGLATAAMTFESLEEAQIWASKITEEHPEISFWFF